MTKVTGVLDFVNKKRNFWTINPITRRTKTKKEKIESAETKHRKVVNYES